jgi:PAS domain-containing protein
MINQPVYSIAIRKFLFYSVWVATGVVTVISLLYFTGLYFKTDILRNPGPGVASMKPTLAVCFLLGAMSLVFLLDFIKTKQKFKFIPVVFGAIIVLIAILTTAFYCNLWITGKLAHIKGGNLIQFLVSDEMGVPFISAFNFLFIGIAIILETINSRRAINIAHSGLIVPFILSYLIPVITIPGFPHIKEVIIDSVTLSGSIAFCFLLFGLLCARPESWMMSLFTSSRSGRILVYRILASLILLPIVIGSISNYATLVEPFILKIGVTNLTLAFTFILLAVIWHNARAVNKRDEELLRNSVMLSETRRIAKIGSWKWNESTGELSCSDGMFEILDVGKGKILPIVEELSSRVHPEDLEKFEKAIREARSGNTWVCVEYRMSGKNGKAGYYILRCEFSIDDSGEQVFHGTIQDITDIRIAEEALRESDQRYQDLFNSLIEGFCIIEVIFNEQGKPIDYRFLETNQAFEKQTGLKDVKGKLMRTLVPEYEEYWFENYGKIALTGEPMRFEAEAKMLDSWYEVVAYRIGGDESRKVAVLFNDISDHKSVMRQIRLEARRAKLLSELSGIFMEKGTNPEKLFDIIAFRVSEYIGDMCIITRMSEDRNWLLPAAVYHPDPEARAIFKTLFTDKKIRLGEGNVGKVALTGKPVLVPGNLLSRVKSEISAEFQPYLDKYGLYEYLIVPIKLNSSVIGTIGIMRLEPGTYYSVGDQAFLEEISTRAAMAIKYGQIYDALGKSHEELEKKVLERTHDLSKAINVLSTEQKRSSDVLDLSKIEAGKLFIN